MLSGTFCSFSCQALTAGSIGRLAVRPVGRSLTTAAGSVALTAGLLVLEVASAQTPVPTS